MPFGNTARTVRVAFVGETKDLEAKLVGLGLVAEGSAKRIAETFDAGTSKAAVGLDKLAATGASWGVPFADALDKVGTKFDQATAKSKSFTDAMAATGRLALVAGTVGFAGASAEALKFAESFQTATTTIQNNAGISAQAATKIGKAFLDTAGHSIFSGNQMAAAFGQVAGQLKLTEGAALNATQAVKFMTAAGDLAEATHVDLGTATSALARIMQAYKLSVGQAASASDILFNASKALNNPVTVVAQAMSRLHSRLGALAPSMRETAGLMVELGGQGITGERGIRVVNSALQNIVSNSPKVTAVLKDLGVTVFNSKGQFVGLADVIGQLQPKYAQMTEKQRFLASQMLFGKQAAQVMSQVVLDGAGAFDKATAAAGKAGTAHQAASAQMKTFHNQVEQLKATVEDLGTKFGLYLIPKVEALGHALSTSIDWLDKHKAAATALGVVIGGFLATAVSVFAFQKAKAFVSGVGDMVDAAKNLAGGVSTLAGKIAGTAATVEADTATMAAKTETSMTSAEGSWALFGTTTGTVAGEVTAASAEVEGQAAAMATAVETADASIESANAAAGASFLALLGPIGAVAAAAVGVGTLLNTVGTPDSKASTITGANGLPMYNPRVAPFAHSVGDTSGSGAAVSGSLSGIFGGLGSTFGGISKSLGGVGGLTASDINSLLRTGRLPGGESAASAVGIPASGPGIKGLDVALSHAGKKPKGAGSHIPPHAPGSYTPTSFAIAALLALGVPPTPANVRDFTAWENQEGGNWKNAAKYNPLNTTLGETGAKSINGAGVKAYTSWAQGLAATVSTLRQGNMASILAALHGNAAPGAFSAAVSGSPWGTGAVNAGGVSLSQAAINALVGQLQGPTGATGVTKSVKTLLYANPVPGMTSIGRTDEGVDFTARVGSAIQAIGTGTIVDIIKNWYRGQPLIEERLTSGPNKGQYVYYAEQIKNLVRLGQHVAAGQRIGTVAPSGTGLEIGFGASGGRTLAQATTGYTEGEVTPAGQAFRKFFDSIGKGIFQTVNTSTGAVTGGGAGSAGSISDLIQKFIQGLQKATAALIQTYQNLEQSGTVKTLEKSLGVTTAGTIGVPGVIGRYRMPFGSQPWHLIHGTVQEGRGAAIAHALSSVSGSATMQAIQAGKSPTGLDNALVPLLSKMAAGSEQEKRYQELIVQLVAAGQVKQAKALVAAHGAAMATLAQELYALQVTKNAESLQLQATTEKDETQVLNDTAQKQLTIVKDANQKIVDAMQAAATAIKDKTQIITDVLSAMAEKITDNTQAMADASSAMVTGINDQTQIRVDILGERGLYGLNLLAQQQQVQLDIMKAGFDQQIAVAQQNLDTVKTTQDANVAAAQVRLDQVTLQQDQLVAAAQQNLDTVQLGADVKVAAAQAHVDSVTLAQDVAIQLAQTAVDLSASAPKAQQDIAAAQLKQATASGGLLEAVAGFQFNAVQNAADEAVHKATSSLAIAQGHAAEVEANAQQALATAQGTAANAIAQATQALTGIQDTAAQAEATQQGTISTTQAEAQTQYAGGGIQLNIYGQNLADPLQTANDVGWALRPFLPA